MLARTILTTIHEDKPCEVRGSYMRQQNASDPPGTGRQLLQRLLDGLTDAEIWTDDTLTSLNG